MEAIIINKNAPDRQALKNHLSQEWLETNGLGGYASSSILNCNTRRYHGLLVVESETSKQVLLSRLEESIVLDSNEYFLTVCQYTDHLQSVGFNYFKSFKQTTHPSFTYELGNHSLTKQIMMLDDQDTVLIHYSCNSNKPWQLKIRPLFAGRNFHHARHFNPEIKLSASIDGQKVKFESLPGLPKTYLQVNKLFTFISDSHWYFNQEYLEESARGFHINEDLFSPGWFNIEVLPQQAIIFSASLTEVENLDLAWEQEHTRRMHLTQQLSGNKLQQRLRYTANSFIHRTKTNQLSVTAGFHWFLDWGRDAMIALPGLTLCNHRVEDCCRILRFFASQQQNGLIPNFICNNENGNAYDAVDASLWFVYAVQQFYYYTQDLSAIKKYFWESLNQIFFGYYYGTDFDIHCTDLSLIWAGSKNIKISWMDAVVNGIPITPRYGYAVEINALWYNFIAFMDELTNRHGLQASFDFSTLLKAIKQSFYQVFYYEPGNYLYDFVNEAETNRQIRPNQIFALSLTYSPIEKSYMSKILQTVELHLLTPYGLRTLSNQDADFIGSYGGGPVERDIAYHQGTVWPWLLGHYTDALLKIYDKKQVQEKLMPIVMNLEKHLTEHGIGTIAEIYDGETPYHPNGCISQAWSVAEVLRLLVLLEDKK